MDADFLQYRDFVQAATVTNDVTERSIAMIEVFTHSMRDNEAQLVVAARGEGTQREDSNFDKRSLATLSYTQM